MRACTRTERERERERERVREREREGGKREREQTYDVQNETNVCILKQLRISSGKS